MNKQNILRITLFVSVLALNPAVAQINLRTDMESASAQSSTKQSLKDEIRATLEAKGLERDAAERLVESSVADTEMLTQMVDNIIKSTKVNKEEILSYIGNEILFRKEVHLDRYDALVGMMTKIRQKRPDELLLSQLRIAAEANCILS